MSDNPSSSSPAEQSAGPAPPEPTSIDSTQQQQAQQQQQQQQQLAAVPPPPPPLALRLSLPLPSGKPPLPRSMPASATSSRASSPRGSLAAQPSQRTLNMNCAAQYRAASRIFKADSQPRKGLATGDVVAIRVQGGALLAVTELGGDPTDASTVHFSFQPQEGVDTSNNKTHLEVIRQGKWLGFRSSAAGDRFLQARKRSTPSRLVFFSQNVGTWEQWELGAAGPDPDATDWATLSVTLRHRRLPQFELAAELVRVGAISLPPNAAVTPRSLMVAGTAEQPGSARAAAAGASGDEDPSMERRELQRMSGVLVHEWLHYVDQEKAARMAIEARVAQLADDAAGLRDWAVMQVDSVRQEMSVEVQQLLEAVERKSAKLADANARLTGRLRWGVAMIQAKSEAATKRQVFMWWRWITARKKYCRHVEAKLAQRSNLRLQARALVAWAEWQEQQAALQAALRAAVRRMSYVKLYHAFAAWRDLVAYRRQQEEDAAALVDAVCQHMQRWRLRRLLRSWQQHAEGCTRGRQALQRMAVQVDRRASAHAFAAWRTHVAQRQERLRTLGALVATRQRQRAQQAALDAWRLWTEDQCGARMQEQHARKVLERLHLQHVLRAWLDLQRERADRRRRWDATIAYMQQRRAALRLDAAFAAWQEHVDEQREQRAAFFNAVQHMALRKMSVAFQSWRYLTAFRQHARAVVEQSVMRLSQRTLAAAWQAWQQYVAEQRVARHRVAVCQRRQAAALQHSVLAGWRNEAACRAAERRAVVLCQRRADRNRMAVALAALRSNVEAAAARREQERLAVAWAANQLQARAFAALAEAVARRRQFEQQLGAVAHSVQQGVLSDAFGGWRAAVALSTAESQLVAAAHRRFSRQQLQNRFLAWRTATQEAAMQEARLQRHLRQRAARVLAAAFGGWQTAVQQERDLQRRLEVGVARIAQMRMAWALSVWRQRTADSVAERQLVSAAQRRIARIRMGAALTGWRQHTAQLAAARNTAEQLGAQRDLALQQDCLLGWADHAAQQAQQQAVLMQLVQRRAAWLSLNVLHYWRAYVQHKQQRRAQVQRAVRKLAAVCQRSAFKAWRQAVLERQANDARLAVAERRVAARHATATLAAALRGWRSHTATLAAARAAVDAKVAAEGAVVQRHVFSAWCSHTEAQAVREDHILRVCVGRRCALLQSKALVAWQLFAQRQAHNREAVEVMVHRMARRVMHAALLSWQQAAQERRVRRIAMARFIQRWDAHRKAAALAHWRRLLAERQAAQENLKRCLTRKRIAFRLFRQWYWESFDEDMQETLRTMFEITEEAAVDPLPSRAGSPYGSLLSSPIRQQLYGMPRQEQVQLSTGVAEALARPGAMQPAFLRAAGAQHQDNSSGSLSGFSGSGLGLPQLPQREPLSARLAAAAAAAGHSASVPAGASRPNLGGTALAPLREFAAFTLHTNALLEPVPEVAESPYAARSPAAAAAAAATAAAAAAASATAAMAAPLSSGKASSTASTAIPTSPLTPASGFAAGSSPLTGVSRLPTPIDVAVLQQQQHSPRGLSAAPTPAAGSGWSSSPLGATALSDAPTPGNAFGLASASRGTQVADLHGSALRSPLSHAGTPQPDFTALSLSPSAAQQLANAPTPGAAQLGLQGQYEIRRFSDGTEYMAPSSVPRAAAAECRTPLAAQKTPPPGLAELQADYSIRSFTNHSSMLEEDGWQLSAEATPQPGALGSPGLIAAFPTRSGAAAVGANQSDGSEGRLSAAKTPLMHANPLAL